jgi:hypothetical protein
MLLKMVAMMNETIYAVYTGTEDAPCFKYVGKTLLTVEERWKQHLRGARDGRTKELYEAMRMEGIDTFSVLELDNSDGQTEQDYVTLLIEMAHPLLNSNLGNSKVAKRPDRTFDTINRQALNRTAPRKILHGPAQQLTKSAIVATRIRNEVPTLEQLLAAEWRDCPIEQLGMDAARTGTHAKYTKFGDVSVYIGSRKNGTALIARNTRTGRVCALPKPLWWGAPLDKLFNVLAETMAVEHYWEKVYSE